MIIDFENMNRSEINQAIAEAAAKAKGSDGEPLTVAEAVRLVLDDVTGNGWVDDELEENIQKSAAQLFGVETRNQQY